MRAFLHLSRCVSLPPPANAAVSLRCPSRCAASYSRPALVGQLAVRPVAGELRGGHHHELPPACELRAAGAELFAQQGAPVRVRSVRPVVPLPPPRHPRSRRRLFQAFRVYSGLCSCVFGLQCARAPHSACPCWWCVDDLHGPCVCPVCDVVWGCAGQAAPRGSYSCATSPGAGAASGKATSPCTRAMAPSAAWCGAALWWRGAATTT